jgi:hypothetical protein
MEAFLGTTLRRLLHALAIAALVAGPTAIASAQSPATPAADVTVPKGAAAVPLFRDPDPRRRGRPRRRLQPRPQNLVDALHQPPRRSSTTTPACTWVHGTRIGIAESADGGAHWNYVSEADIPVPAPDYTFWAPEVIDVDGTYHMFLTVVPGTFSDWNASSATSFTSPAPTSLHWKPLAYARPRHPSAPSIACVFRLPGRRPGVSGIRTSADGSKVYFSDSSDLVHWTHKGIATTNHGEGPVVFQWHGHYWLINDPHAGLGVFRSDDLTAWHQQPDNILREPGTQPTDRAVGSHADVVVDAAGRAWLFYFTQQGGENASRNTRGYGRHSVLHVTELHEANGILTVDRNAPAYIHLLPPPKNKKERHRQTLVKRPTFALARHSPIYPRRHALCRFVSHCARPLVQAAGQSALEPRRIPKTKRDRSNMHLSVQPVHIPNPLLGGFDTYDFQLEREAR